MQQAIPSLDSKGWIQTPIEIVKFIIGDYMVADHNQSSLLPQVRCFMIASGKHNNNPVGISANIQEDMEILLKDVLADLQVNVRTKDRIGDDGLPTNSYDIDIIVTSSSFSENQEQSHLSYSAVIKDGFLENFIFNYIEDK